MTVRATITWSGHREQIRETSHLQAHVTPWPIGPVIRQLGPALPGDVNVEDGACHRVVADGEDDHVRLKLSAVFHPDSFLADPRDGARAGLGLFGRRALERDELDVRLVERLEIPRVEHRALTQHEILRR